jgi:hypothetical protein
VLIHYYRGQNPILGFCCTVVNRKGDDTINMDRPNGIQHAERGPNPVLHSVTMKHHKEYSCRIPWGRSIFSVVNAVFDLASFPKHERAKSMTTSPLPLFRAPTPLKLAMSQKLLSTPTVLPYAIVILAVAASSAPSHSSLSISGHSEATV